MNSKQVMNHAEKFRKRKKTNRNIQQNNQLI